MPASVGQRFNPDAILQRMQLRQRELVDEADRLRDDYLQGRISADTFVEQFLPRKVLANLETERAATFKQNAGLLDGLVVHVPFPATS